MRRIFAVSPAMNVGGQSGDGPKKRRTRVKVECNCATTVDQVQQVLVVQRLERFALLVEDAISSKVDCQLWTSMKRAYTPKLRCVH